MELIRHKFSMILLCFGRGTVTIFNFLDEQIALVLCLAKGMNYSKCLPISLYMFYYFKICRYRDIKLMKGAANFIFNSAGWNEYFAPLLWLFAPSPETLMSINLASNEKQRKKPHKIRYELGKYISLYLKLSCDLSSVLYSLGSVSEDYIFEYYYFDSSEDLSEIPRYLLQCTENEVLNGWWCLHTPFLEPSVLSMFVKKPTV